MAIRAVSFDFHGTLAAVSPSPGAIYSRVAADFGLYAEADELSQHFGLAFQRVRQAHEIPYGCDESDARDFWFAVIVDCFQSCLGKNITISETLCMALFDAFGRGDSWEVLPGVRECLAWCWDNRIATLVCSNFDARIHRVLKDLELGGFKQVIPSSLVGIPKPDPEILLLATSLLVIEPEELLHVGDNAEEDGLAAKAAGCPFHKVQANAGPSLPALSAQINSLGSCPE